MPGNPKRKQRSVCSSLLLFFLFLFVVFGVFGECAYVFVLDNPDKSKWTKAQAEMGEIQKALNQYALDHDLKYPTKLDELTVDFFESGLPKDPFTKDDYIYELTLTGFTLTCLGKDQNVGGDDEPDKDIVFNEKGVID